MPSPSVTPAPLPFVLRLKIELYILFTGVSMGERTLLRPKLAAAYSRPRTTIDYFHST